MTNKNNISLEKTSKKHTCPSCSKQRFVRYYNYDTKEYLPDHVGRCDREQNCGYHYTPKQYFSDNNIKIDIRKKVIQTADKLVFQFSFDEIIKNNVKQLNGCKWNAKTKQWYIDNNKLTDEVLKFAKSNNFDIVEFSKPLKPSFISTKLLMKFKDDKNAIEKNNFLKFLKSIFKLDTIKFLYSQFLIGTMEQKTIFWQIDDNIKIRTGKIIEYNTNGKRTNNINWIHSTENLKDFNLSQCLFGLHNITSSPENKIIGIVESEKTAIIMTGLSFERGFLSNYVWLATGQKNLLKVELLKPLAKRKIVLFPDTGNDTNKHGIQIKTPFEVWSDKMPKLQKEVSKKIEISDLLERSTTPEQKKQGLDIADFVIMELKNGTPPKKIKKILSKEDQKFNFLLEKNSNLMNLVEVFECVSTSTNKPFEIIENYS